MKPLKPERLIRNTALDLLARREHTRLELTRKLKAKKFSSSEIDELLDHLQGEGLQSDKRYTESYVHSRGRRGFGPLRIKLELQERGIASDLVDAYVDFNDQVWLDVACKEYEKKFGAQATESAKDRAKHMRFLQSRGFTGDIIQKTFATFSAR